MNHTILLARILDYRREEQILPEARRWLEISRDSEGEDGARRFLFAYHRGAASARREEEFENPYLPPDAEIGMAGRMGYHFGYHLTIAYIQGVKRAQGQEKRWFDRPRRDEEFRTYWAAHDAEAARLAAAAEAQAAA